MVPGDLLALFQLPGAELRSQSQCNDPVHSSEKKEGYGSGAARHTQAHLQSGVGGPGTERDRGLSPGREVFAGRRMPPGAAAPGPDPARSQVM